MHVCACMWQALGLAISGGGKRRKRHKAKDYVVLGKFSWLRICFLIENSFQTMVLWGLSR